MDYPVVFALTVELAAKTSPVMPLNKVDGCWLRKCGDFWVAINGHDLPVTVKPDAESMEADVPAFNVAVWSNGWLLGFVDAGGGILMAGGRPDTEAEVCEALEAELRELTAA
jgi:hypothetical protein